MNAVSTAIEAMLHKISSQGAVVPLTTGAAFLLGITSAILLSRLLGTIGLSKFQFGSVVVQLVTGFCVLGLDKALLRYVPILEARGETGRSFADTREPPGVRNLAASFRGSLARCSCLSDILLPFARNDERYPTI